MDYEELSLWESIVMALNNSNVSVFYFLLFLLKLQTPNNL